jgi:ADP-heptose:LPS heptosyltransferase
LLTSELGLYDFRADDVDQNARLLAAAGLDPGTDASPELRPAARDVTAARWLLAARGLAGASALVVLHAGSDWACQMWGQEKWAALADKLAARGAQVVFTGSAGEVGHVEGIRSLMRAPSASLVGETSIGQLGALLAGARLCVSVDSGAYVVAQATGVPTVVVAGPSNPDRLVSSRRLPVIVNRTSPALTGAILACKEPKYPAGGCLDFACPMAGLRDVAVGDVLAAVDRTGALPGAA